MTTRRTPGRAPDGREAQRQAALTRPNWALATLGGGYGGRRSVPIAPDVTAFPSEAAHLPDSLRAGRSPFAVWSRRRQGTYGVAR